MAREACKDATALLRRQVAFHLTARCFLASVIYHTVFNCMHIIYIHIIVYYIYIIKLCNKTTYNVIYIYTSICIIVTAKKIEPYFQGLYRRCFFLAVLLAILFPTYMHPSCTQHLMSTSGMMKLRGSTLATAFMTWGSGKIRNVVMPLVMHRKMPEMNNIRRYFTQLSSIYNRL